MEPVERITSRILLVRGHKIMLDANLAELYGVTTMALNQTVKRNAERFPEDFAFQLTPAEAGILRSLIATASLQLLKRIDIGSFPPAAGASRSPSGLQVRRIR